MYLKTKSGRNVYMPTPEEGAAITAPAYAKQKTNSIWFHISAIMTLRAPVSRRQNRREKLPLAVYTSL